MIRPPIHTESHNNLERWLLTYADMITLLTAFFLMLYSMSVMSKGKFSAIATSVRSGFNGPMKGGPHILNGGGSHGNTTGLTPNLQFQQAQEAMRNLRQYVEEKKLGGKVATRQEERGTVISLVSDNMLFERGRAALKPESRGVLEKISRVLKTAPNTVQIEGHTCNLPIRTAQFPSNWELSTARAGAVLRAFTEGFGLPNVRFRASGYAETQPLAPNTTETNRARNRRVDIVLLKTEQEQQANLQRQSEIRRITGGNTPQKTGQVPASDASVTGQAGLRPTNDSLEP